MMILPSLVSSILVNAIRKKNKIFINMRYFQILNLKPTQISRHQNQRFTKPLTSHPIKEIAELGVSQAMGNLLLLVALMLV